MSKYKLVPVEPTNKMIVELISVGLRHAEYVDGQSPAFDDIKLGYKFMLAAAPEAKSGLGWRPIETAPMDMTVILVFTNYGDMYVSFYNGRHWEPANIQSYGTADIDGEPTHWMPLPEPPESES